MAADALGLVQEWLQGKFPTHRSVTELPNDLVAASPVHRVARVGGPRRYALDTMQLSVQTFVAGTQRQTRDVAERVCDAIRYDLPGATVAGAAVTKVECTAAPTDAPYGNINVNMATHSYTVHVLTV